MPIVRSSENKVVWRATATVERSTQSAVEKMAEIAVKRKIAFLSKKEEKEGLSLDRVIARIKNDIYGSGLFCIENPKVGRGLRLDFTGEVFPFESSREARFASFWIITLYRVKHVPLERRPQRDSSFSHFFKSIGDPSASRANLSVSFAEILAESNNPLAHRKKRKKTSMPPSHKKSNNPPPQKKGAPPAKSSKDQVRRGQNVKGNRSRDDAPQVREERPRPKHDRVVMTDDATPQFMVSSRREAERPPFEVVTGIPLLSALISPSPQLLRRLLPPHEEIPERFHPITTKGDWNKNHMFTRIAMSWKRRGLPPTVEFKLKEEMDGHVDPQDIILHVCSIMRSPLIHPDYGIAAIAMILSQYFARIDNWWTDDPAYAAENQRNAELDHEEESEEDLVDDESEEDFEDDAEGEVEEDSEEEEDSEDDTEDEE